MPNTWGTGIQKKIDEWPLMENKTRQLQSNMLYIQLICENKLSTNNFIFQGIIFSSVMRWYC